MTSLSISENLQLSICRTIAHTGIIAVSELPGTNGFQEICGALAVRLALDVRRKHRGFVRYQEKSWVRKEVWNGVRAEKICPDKHHHPVGGMHDLTWGSCCSQMTTFLVRVTGWVFLQSRHQPTRNQTGIGNSYQSTKRHQMNKDICSFLT